MSNLKKHFDRELAIMRANLKEGDRLVIEDFIPEIESIIEKFSNQGHSGMSASMYANSLCSTLKKALMFKSLSPLTGADEEWNDVGEMCGQGVYQNNRQSSVFKEGKDGRAYFLDAIVWQGEEDYDTFTGSVEGIKSRQFIKSFPFTPKTFYIDVYKDFDWQKYPENEVVEGNEQYVYRLKDPKQLEAVFEYYQKQ